IIEVNREKERVSLGLKQTTKNPWDEIDRKYPVGAKVHGKVVNLVPYGAFVEIEPGVEGLVHITEMSWTKRITKPSELLKVGQELKDGIDALVHISQISEDRIDKVKDVLKPQQEVTARVIKIDREERRLGLSIKAANYSPDQLAAETSAYEALNRSAGNDMMNLG